MNLISIPSIAMSAVMFYVGFYHFLIFLRQKNNRENLTFALSCFSVGLYAVCCAGLYNAPSPGAGVEWQRLQVITLSVLGISLLWFIADYTGRINQKIVIGFTVYYSFAALMQLVIRTELTWTNLPSIKEIELPFGYIIRYNEMVPGSLTDFNSMMGLLYFIYILIVSLKFYTSGNKERGMPLLIAMVILFAGLLNDSFISSGFYDFIYILEYSYIGFILVFTFFLIHNVIKAGEIKIALLKSEKKYKTLFDKTNDAIFIVEKSTGRYLDANTAATELTGYPLEQLKQLTTHDLTPGETHDHLAGIKKSDETRELGIVTYHRPDNSQRIARLSVVPFNDVGVIGIAKDITHDLEVESQLRQSQKMEAIGTLAGGVAHDFNNILTGIFGYTQLVELNIGEPEKIKKNLNQILKGAKRAAELVQQILAFSRQGDYNKKPLRISLVVTEVIQFLRSTIPSTTIIEENISSKAIVLADSSMTHQVVMNLCTNAHQAMHNSKGRLTITLDDVETTQQDHPLGGNHTQGQYVRLEVKDTGHGMDKETLEKIFDPYFSTKKTDKGTGLGLAVVDGIVTSHKGFMRVKSEVGCGSTFEVFWPVIEKRASLRIHEKNNTRILKGIERIMIVDDETDILDTSKEILERHGYKITIFENGLMALQAFKENPGHFDLVITDMTMPHISGDKLSAELIRIRPDIPILICTGFSEILSEQKAASLGIKAFIKKPIVMKDLSEKIREVLDTHTDSDPTFILPSDTEHHTI